MKDIIDILNLQVIQESMFDLDKLDAQLEKETMETLLKNNLKGNYKLKFDKTRNAYKVTGKLIISGYKGDTLPESFVIYEMKGDLHIEDCPNLLNLYGLFYHIDDIMLGQLKGSLYIENCQKLSSIVGIPNIIEGDMVLSNLPMFNRLDELPKHVFGSLSLIKLKKRYKQPQVKQHTDAYQIFCSLDEQYDMINESLDEPYFNRFVEYLKSQDVKVNLVDLFGYIHFDKIRSSNVTVLKCPFDGENGRLDIKKAESQIRKVTQNSSMWIIALDENDDFTGLVGKYHTIYRFGDPSKRWTSVHGQILKPTEFIRYFSSKRQGKILIYDCSDLETCAIRSKRYRDKQGIISQESYDEILKRNRQRYRRAVEQLKAQRAEQEYKDLAKEVEQLNIRLSKAFSKMLDPVFAASHYWDVKDAQESVSKAIGKFSDLVRLYTSIRKGEGTDWQMNSVKVVKEELKRAIEITDQKLSRIGL